MRHPRMCRQFKLNRTPSAWCVSVCWFGRYYNYSENKTRRDPKCTHVHASVPVAYNRIIRTHDKDIKYTSADRSVGVMVWWIWGCVKPGISSTTVMFLRWRIFGRFFATAGHTFAGYFMSAICFLCVSHHGNQHARTHMDMYTRNHTYGVMCLSGVRVWLERHWKLTADMQLCE